MVIQIWRKILRENDTWIVQWWPSYSHFTNFPEFPSFVSARQCSPSLYSWVTLCCAFCWHAHCGGSLLVTFVWIQAWCRGYVLSTCRTSTGVWRHQSLWVMIAPHAPTCTPYPAGFGLCHARMHIRTLSSDVCIEVAWVCVRCTLGRLDGNGRVRSREPALGQREAGGVAGGERALVGVSGRSFGDRSSNSSLIKTCDASQVRFPRELMQEHRFIQACKESSLKIHLLSLIHRTLVP